MTDVAMGLGTSLFKRKMGVNNISQPWVMDIKPGLNHSINRTMLARKIIHSIKSPSKMYNSPHSALSLNNDNNSNNSFI